MVSIFGFIGRRNTFSLSCITVKHSADGTSIHAVLMHPFYCILVASKISYINTNSKCCFNALLHWCIDALMHACNSVYCFPFSICVFIA